jgi:hypothetical protein
VAGVIVLVAVAVALFLLLGEDDGSNTASGSSSTSSAEESTSAAERSSSGSSRSTSESDEPADGASIPEATVTPDGLGDDPVLDEYAQSCYDGDMEACDDLFKESELDSVYEAYGDTCAGRQPLDTDIFCTVSFPDE